LLETLEDDVLICILTSGSLCSRDFGRLACVSRRFNARGLVENVARQLVTTTAIQAATARLEFEKEQVEVDSNDVAQKKRGWHDHTYPLSRAAIVEIWGYNGELDVDDEPDADGLAEEQEENAQAKLAWQEAEARVALAHKRVADCEARLVKARDGGLEEPWLPERGEQWLRALNRTAQKLIFSAACSQHMMICCGGQVAMVKKGASAYTSAVCAQHPMLTGTHRADFTIGQASGGQITLGVLLTSHDPCAFNVGRNRDCDGAFCGRPSDTKSGWGFTEAGKLKHTFAACANPPTVGDGTGFRTGDRVRLELELDGQWGSNSRSPRVLYQRSTILRGPGTRATLTAYVNGVRQGTVATFEKQPNTGFVWLVEMVAENDWVRIG